MNERFEIDEILNFIDFSQGREKVVWEKILSRLPRDIGALPFSELDNVAGGLSHNIERCDNSEDLLKK